MGSLSKQDKVIEDVSVSLYAKSSGWESQRVLGEDKFAIWKLMPKCVCQAKYKIPSPHTKNPKTTRLERKTCGKGERIAKCGR